MKPVHALVGSVAIAVLTIAGGVLFTYAADSNPTLSVAWSEEAGNGTVFPACGSAIIPPVTCTTPECSGNINIGAVSCDPDSGSGYTTLGWDFSGDSTTEQVGIAISHDGNFVTLPFPQDCGYPPGWSCTGSVTGSTPISGLAPGAYSYSAYTPTEFTSHSSDITINFTVPACAAPALSLRKGQLPGGSCVGGGPVNATHNLLCYRMSFGNAGAGNQTNVRVTDAIPDNTTFDWQGGGTDGGSGVQSGSLWWNQSGIPAGQSGYYVDFNTRLNAGVSIGTPICNTATIKSDQILTPFPSNEVCNTVGPISPPWIRPVCNSDNTAVNISWGAFAGATYYPRVYIPSGSCPSGWLTASNGHTCYKDGYAETSIDFPVTPGASYGTWVHAGDPVDWDLEPTGTSFSCTSTDTPNVSAVCPSPGVNAPISWSAVSGATSYSIIVNIPSADSCPWGWTTDTWAPDHIQKYCELTTDSSTFSTNFTAGMPGTTYSTAVRSFPSGIYGEQRNFTCTPMDNPSISATCPSPGTSAPISWSPVDGATAYHVIVNIPSAESCPSGWTTAWWAPANTQKYCDLATGSSTFSTSFAPTMLGTTYVTAVRAFSGVVGGPYSSEKSFTCQADLPDLTAGTVTPTSATTGTPTTFSATITNQGAGQAGNPFKNFAQIDTDSNHVSGNETDLGVTSPDVPAGFAAGASTPVTFSHTFASVGTYYLRVCADNDWAGGAGYNNEGTKEGNNCGPWTQITVASPVPPTCSPSTQSVISGGTATWTASGGAGSPFSWFDALDVPVPSCSGSSCSRSYSTAGTYGVYVKDSAGTHSPACQVTVGCSGLTNSITANPTRLPAPGTTDVTWTASGVSTSCVITKNGLTRDTKNADACAIPGGGGMLDNDSVSIQTTYCITCDGKTAQKACVTVNVGGDFREF